MGLWARISVTALASLAVGVACWLSLEMAGAGQTAAATVASVAATVVVTLGAVWVSRARDTKDPAAISDAMVSASLLTHAHGPVFGPGSSFDGATIAVHGTPPQVTCAQHGILDRQSWLDLGRAVLRS